MTKPEKIFDGLLVLQYQNGNKKALSLLVKRWHVKLCNQAYWYTKDTNVAKDIAQDCWSIILKKIHDIKEPHNFGAWALTIVNRKAIDYLRSTKRTNEKLQEYHKDLKSEYDENKDNTTIVGTGISVAVPNSETIIDVIKKLPENQQIILRLFYLEEYSIIEISSILEISKGTVKSRLFYAREKIKSILKKQTHEKQ